MAAMIISQDHVPASTFGFEVGSLETLANHEIDAAAVAAEPLPSQPAADRTSLGPTLAGSTGRRIKSGRM